LLYICIYLFEIIKNKNLNLKEIFLNDPIVIKIV